MGLYLLMGLGLAKVVVIFGILGGVGWGGMHSLSNFWEFC
jgi:hypothetical protein